MRKYFYILVSFITILAIQLSALQVTFSYHYCANELMDIAFFEKLEECEPSNVATNLIQDTFVKGSCCDLQLFSVDGIDFTDHQTSNVQVINPTFFSQNLMEIPSEFSERIFESCQHYSSSIPPKSGRDILVNVQRFII